MASQWLIDALRLLLDVAEIGSFSGVAHQRTMATATVALAISRLEHEAARKIVMRSTRKLVFTHEGVEETARLETAFAALTVHGGRINARQMPRVDRG